MSFSINNKCIRMSVPNEVTSCQFPSDVTKVVVTNKGEFSVKAWFSGDGSTDYYTFAPGETVPFDIVPGVSWNLDGVGGSSSLEILCS